MSDEELMARLQGGEEAALAGLMERWEIPLKRFLFRLVGNAAEADDLAQEVFVRVFCKRHTYRTGARFSSWVFAIAANQAKNRLRWWHRRPTRSLNAWIEEGGEVQDVATDPRELARLGDQRERMAAIQTAVADLPLDQRTALVLFEYENKSVAEIAVMVGGTVKAVENRLYRARQKLRQRLVGEGGQPLTKGAETP